MNVWFRRCASFEEEAEADREFWLQYSPAERVELVEEIRNEGMNMTNGPQPSRDQREFLELLHRHDVRALVVGAHALAFHAAKDDLIRNKAASGRAQDLADLELLRRF